MIMPSRRKCLFLTLGIVILAALAVIIVSQEKLLERSPLTGETKKQSKEQLQRPTEAPSGPLTPSSQNDLESLGELISYLKSPDTQTKSADRIYSEIARMKVIQQPWWRNSTDFGELLNFALDPKFSEDSQVVSLRLFLAGVPIEALQETADQIQKKFANSSDQLVSALLQDMADRKVPPKTLIRSTLADSSRGEHAQCMAWYAARLTDRADLELASIALAEPKGGFSTTSKVGFDYLAAGPVSEQVNNTPSLRRMADEHLMEIMKLPVSAEIIELANADAFIMAIPNLMDSERSHLVLLEILHNSPNPEVKLSALKQIVKCEVHSDQELSRDTGAIKKNISTIFPDQVKQIRALAILNRSVPSSPKKTK